MTAILLALGSVVLLVVVLVASQPYSAAGLARGTVTGAVGAVGLVAYYQALATGQPRSSPPWPPAGPCCRWCSTWSGAAGRGRWPGPGWSWSWPGSR